MKYKKIAFLFPGQGAQTVGMGREFYNVFSLARETYEEADSLLHRSLSTIIFEGPLESLTETSNSQVGIFVTSIALLRVLSQQFPLLKPAICAGLSLGEYTALTASERVSFDICLPLVQFRGEVMGEACRRVKGTMAAIFGLSAHAVEEMVSDLKLPNDLWVANFNCPGQTVISGTLKGVEAGIEAAKRYGAKRTIPLKVHGAFHSGLMEHAKEKLAPLLEQMQLCDSAIQLVMNVPGSYVQETSLIHNYLIQQVTSPVRWEQGIRVMEGVDLFIEIGCGKTLAGLNKQMELSVPTLTIQTPADLDLLAQTIG